MFRFFLPASKVQKDRRIMRETDARMAKYSRRGVVFNVFAYLVCVSYGDFVVEHTSLMVVLTTGLMLITLIRAFFLFRFDSLYPRAPTKWRDSYFVATLLGAMWWGVILVSLTLTMKMSGEAGLIWIYTVIFFSSTAHAFAPYQKFLSYYQFFGLMPAAGAAFYLGNLEGVIYGSMMVGFYFVLTHQCRLISENYWERLEATYALARKTVSMEEEKRDTRANVKLNEEFIDHLCVNLESFLTSVRKSGSLTKEKLREKVESELAKLCTNVSDFSGVLSKELVLDENIFNIRHEIQHIVAEYIDDAERREIQIETSLSPTLPMRLKGDAPRLAQIIRSLLSMSVQGIEKCVILVEVEFLREYESAGELYISVTRSFEKSKKLFSSEKPPELPAGSLSLVLAKGLAELMNGSIEVHETPQEEQQFRFSAKINIAEYAGQLDFHKNTFSGKNVLLVHSHHQVTELKKTELEALGFNVFVENQFKKALLTLENSYKLSSPIGSLVFYVENDRQGVLDFCAGLNEIPELKYTHKVSAATRQQQHFLRQQGYDENAGFYFVDRPMGLFEIESVFHQLFFEQEVDEDASDVTGDLRVALFTRDLSNKENLKKQAEQFGDDVIIIDIEKPLSVSMGEVDFSIAMVDCDANADIAELVHGVRDMETRNGAEIYMPIVGISKEKDNIEDSAYEMGLDDYIDLTHNPKKTMKETLRYWASLVNND